MSPVLEYKSTTNLEDNHEANIEHIHTKTPAPDPIEVSHDSCTPAETIVKDNMRHALCTTAGGFKESDGDMTTADRMCYDPWTLAAKDESDDPRREMRSRGSERTETNSGPTDSSPAERVTSDDMRSSPQNSSYEIRMDGGWTGSTTDYIHKRRSEQVETGETINFTYNPKNNYSTYWLQGIVLEKLDEHSNIRLNQNCFRVGMIRILNFWGKYNPLPESIVVKLTKHGFFALDNNDTTNIIEKDTHIKDHSADYEQVKTVDDGEPEYTKLSRFETEKKT